MDFDQILGLGLLQGLTEFLPISSSAHLILLPLVVGWTDQGLAFDVAVHLGTLLAVVCYFRSDLKKIVVGWVGSLIYKKQTQESRLAWMIVVGTIPVGLVGLLAGSLVEIYLRSPSIIAVSTILFGLLLWFADVKGKRSKNEDTMTIKMALVIGLYQVLALIPGTSRSGITMTGGLLLGLTREAAARFSFLLSVPLIFLAGSLKSFELINSSETIDWVSISLGVLISALSAFACIAVFLRLLEKIGMLPFVLYRLVLGGFLLYFYGV
ncbi:MAG: undecaprenyl-diphosphatase [Cycloclasticus sp.]|nr:undecaprenyl-diphosphatase [Cycloclasticus sp.]MBG96938.1 undecaprenyl-diphosphatase [Cycloclasticus sp.]HAI95917.1 undecaprenyl-diphosphatase [Methylococcaceae bacterium]|tara:strand:+ start:841 stop:1641 length:801 start_codon:yes stop_codon:yes gene_type:complete